MSKKALLKKILIMTSVPSILVGTALTFSLAFKDKKLLKDFVPPHGLGENFFDKQVVVNNSSFIKNSVFFPFGEIKNKDKSIFVPKNLLYDYIPLDRNSITIKNIKNMIQKNNVKPIKNIEVRFGEFNSEAEVEKKFLEINKALYEFKRQKENLNTKMGIYWYSDARIRTSYIKVYKLEKISNDEKLANAFMIGLKNHFKRPKNSDEEMKFIQIFSSIIALRPVSLKTKLWFPDLDKENNPDYPNLYKDETIETVDIKNDNGVNKKVLDINFDPQNPYYVKTALHNNTYDNSAFKTLLKNRIQPLIISTVDYEAKKLKCIIYFNHLDKNSTIMTSSMDDGVKNPTNITKRIFEVDIKTILQQLDTKDSDKGLITNNSTNREKLFQSLSIEWRKYMAIPFVKPGLDILSRKITSLKGITQNIYDIITIMGNLKTGKTKIKEDIKNMKPLDYLFKTEYNIDSQSKDTNSTLLNKIITAMNSASDLAFPKIMWRTAFKDFNGSNDPTKNKWSSADTFINADAADGTMYNLYNLLTSWEVVGPIIKKRILEIAPTAYKDLEDSSWLEHIVEILRKNNLISGKQNIEDVISNWEDIVIKLVNNAKDGKSFSLDHQSIAIGLSLLLNKINYQKRDEIAKVLSDLFKDPKNLGRLIKLAAGKASGKEFLTLFKDDPLKIINLIINNNSIDEDFVKTLGQFLFDKKLLSTFINAFIGGGINLEPLIDGLESGFKNITAFKAAINSISLNLWDKNLFGNFTLGESILNPIFDGKKPPISILLPSNNNIDWNIVSTVFKNGLKSLSKKQVETLFISLKRIMSIILNPEKGIAGIIKGAGINTSSLTSIYNIFDKLVPGNSQNKYKTSSSDTSKKFANIVWLLTRSSGENKD